MTEVTVPSGGERDGWICIWVNGQEQWIKANQPTELSSNELEVLTNAGIGFVDSGNPDELLVENGWEYDGAMATVGNRIVCDVETEQGLAVQNLAAELANTNAPYYVTAAVDSITQGHIVLNEPGYSISAPGTYRVPAALMGSTFYVSSFDFCDAVITSVSVKALNDNQLGIELIANGTFSSGTGWALHGDAGLTITGGKLVAADEAIAYAVSTGTTVEVGALYKLVWTASGLETGSMTIYVETAADTYTEQSLRNSSIDEDGTRTDYWIANAAGKLTIRSDAAIMSLDNVSLRKYSVPTL